VLMSRLCQLAIKWVTMKRERERSKSEFSVDSQRYFVLDPPSKASSQCQPRKTSHTTSFKAKFSEKVQDQKGCVFNNICFAEFPAE
jgi:hypothetical protein